MTKPVSPRFLALDVLRGMTICFMIIVNTPGSGATSFAPLLHAAWHGFTPIDLVFPTFLFVVQCHELFYAEIQTAGHRQRAWKNI